MLRTGLLALLGVISLSSVVAAQPAPGGCKIWTATSEQLITVTSTSHYRLIRNVQVDCNDMQFFADEAEIFSDADRLRASGNVVFVSSNNRISAQRMDFNTRTRTGTFYVASGIASLENRGIDRSLFGTQEPDAYFWGETIEKLGPKTYRITRGGFTTCVQPTPRWELVSNSVTLTLEKHAVVKNAILKVKDVPLFYMPVMYYPINKEDRATGFLIPIYGTSTIKGQMITNSFFWAINRSQDALFEHDFFSQTGQGVGTEYRYVQGPGSQGDMKFHYINEHDATYTNSSGTPAVQPGSTSYSIDGTLGQRLPGHLRVAAQAYYFSSISAQQRYNQNIFAATNRTRRYYTNLSGNWGRFAMSSTVDRSETFYNATTSYVYGSAPRVTLSRAEAPIGDLPLYFGANGEYVTLVRSDKSGTTTIDRGLSRFDIYPTLRFPFTRWQFLTFNSSLTARATYWTESLEDPKNLNSQGADPIHRTYLDVSSRITGPVFTRIWNTPKRGWAQKFKHVIEPVVSIQRITSIDNFDRIVKTDGTDYVVGKTTRITYGLNNRLYAKKDSAREILTVSLSQTYNTDANATKLDAQYQSGYISGLPPSHVSPVALQVRVSPATGFDTTFRTEYDTQVHALRTLAANGTWTGRWLQTTAGWSERRFIPQLPGFNDPLAANHYMNATTTVRPPGNPYGGTYSFDYDIGRSLFRQQRIIGYYNTQCCGFAVEYQTFNYGTVFTNIGISQDHRFNISFTLAGIGTFSNLLGAFGGQRTR
jgi:LPS-assembly protein